MNNIDLVTFFKGLTDETRQRILNLLLHLRPLNVNELCEILRLPQSNVSHHLSQLRLAGWVTSSRRDKWVYYRIHPDVPAELHDALRKMFAHDLRFQNDLSQAKHQLGES